MEMSGMSGSWLMSGTRDTERHVPSKLLPLRQHSVLVGDNINIAGPQLAEGASCHSRRTDISDNEPIRASSEMSGHRDIEESLRDSYTLMKTKLDQMEDYNRALELQLGAIFKSINSSAKTKTEPSRVTDPSPASLDITGDRAPPSSLLKLQSSFDKLRDQSDDCDKQTETHPPRSDICNKLSLARNSVSSSSKSSRLLHPHELGDNDDNERSLDRFSDKCPLVPGRAQAPNNEEDKNPSLQLDGAGHDPVNRDQVSRKYSSIHGKNDDLSNIIRELRVSDIGELKRAVLLKKTRRSVSVSSSGTNPYLDSPSRDVNDPIKIRELQKNPSDLNNNDNDTQSEEEKPSAFITSKASKVSDKLPPKASSPPSSAANPDHCRGDIRGNEACREKCSGERVVSTKKYFSSSRGTGTERRRSSSDSPLLYQFYPSKQNLRHKFTESWHPHNQTSEEKCLNKHKLNTLENITEDSPAAIKNVAESNEGSFRTLAELRSKRSERRFSSSDTSERNSSFTHLYEKLCHNPHFQYSPSITDSQSTVYKSSSFKSSSSFSPSTLSSFSSICASTDCANTEEEYDELTSDSFDLLSSHDEPELVDEFFLFPYDVLDADFDTICVELSRYSPDIELCLHKSEKTGQLKAAKASDEWNTLWIYRGI